MVKRLGIGLLKGLVVGALLGAGLQIGLGWTTLGLGGFLLAMGAGATAGILCGKPPWKAEAWIEALLKGVAGVGVGALLYWLTSSYLSFDVPWTLPGAVEGTAWIAQPILWAPIFSAIFGAIVELDNTGDEGDQEPSTPSGRKRKKAPRTRVTGDFDLGAELDVSAGKKKGRA